MNTPLYIKDREDMPWPKDKFFYIQSKDGLFKCRTHPFYTSAVKVDSGHPELVAQDEFCEMRYPKVPQKMMEDTVAFFADIARRHDTEAIILIGYNTKTHEVMPVVPVQWSVVWESKFTKGKCWGGLNIKYEVPASLPPNVILIGDIHSHVNIGAGHSGVDENDETNRPGVHIIVGRISQEPPDMSADIVVDGTRFDIRDLSMVIEEYEKRSPVCPAEWFDKFSLKVEKQGQYKPGRGHHLDDEEDWRGDSQYYGYSPYNPNRYKPKKRDEKADRKLYKRIGKFLGLPQ